MDVQLFLTPIPSSQRAGSDKTVVLIDVLRCTTCIAALVAGARGVIPPPGPGEAVDMWTKVGAALTLSCSLTNISKVADRIASQDNDIVIICSGRGGQFSMEDTICGGMLLHLLSTDKKLKASINDAGSLALLLYRSNKNALRQTIAQGEHGRYLSAICFGADVSATAVTDSMPVLPILREGQLVAADK